MSSRTIAVTGTSRGIGVAIALELARRGFIVGCLARNGKIPVGDEAAQLNKQLIPIQCDVTDEAGLAKAFKQLAAQTGGIDGLVNNAGIHMAGASRAFSTTDFDRILKVNTLAVFVACREIYPHLLARGGGSIINIGSFFAELGAKGSTAYSASKAAVAAITRCLAAEWGSKGISVLNVAPGYIETDINRDFLNNPATGGKMRERIFVGRPGRTDEVARLIATVLSERIDFLTGGTITIDGGQGISL
jgi:NAD(P)-dependent dehydrogenase (short-subunit alcohol dehydrogenase family)